MGTEVEQRSEGKHQCWRVGTVNMASVATVNYSSFRRSLLAANAEMKHMKDEADRLLVSARSFKGPPSIQVFIIFPYFGKQPRPGISVSPQQGGGSVPASVAKQTPDVAHTYCFFCACDARSLAFSLAASAVSLARSVAVSAKVLDGISPAKSQRRWVKSLLKIPTRF